MYLISYPIRSVYEGPEPSHFEERLDHRIKNHDKEIERMCNYHYQGFIESVRGLLQVRTDVECLKLEINKTNDDLQNSGDSLLGRGGDLVKLRKTQRNIESAVDALSLCLPVLETYGKLKEQLRLKRYYPALKTLEQLEHSHLPRVSKYKFLQPMCETIPTLRDSIKDASMTDLKDFLESIRKHSEHIGHIAMKHQCAEQNKMDPSIVTTQGKKRPAPLPPKLKRKAPPPPNPFGDDVDDGTPNGRHNPFNDEGIETGDEAQDAEEGVSAQDLIDFSPVYRCLHIYSVVGARDTFESYYRKQRRKQARLALQPPPNMQDTLDGYKRYFHDIIGFFVVEDHILNTTSGLVNRAYIDELWDMALLKVVAVLRTHIGFCTDATLMLQIKNLIMLFSLTLRGYGFTVSQLYDLLLEIRDQYSEILMKKWVEVFNGIFQMDNYTPICVNTIEEYEAVTALYPFMDSRLEKSPFPKNLPFSQFVPNVYSEVKEYIYACLKFSEDLHLSQNEIDDMIRKLANVLLTRTLSGCLSELIKRPQLHLLQLIQISINMNHLEQSCVFLEDFISNITGLVKDNVHVSRLQGTSMFKDARSEAEGQIYKRINEKIDEFFDLANYDWTATDPRGQPSEYISDIIAFLQSTFIAFTNLPEKVAQTACMSACKHMASLLMELLKDHQVREISIGALQQLNLDLVQCEHFAASDPVPGLNDGTLQLAFVDLRQLMDVFLEWDWANYIADHGKATGKYIRVPPATCILLLEKMRDLDKKKSNLLASFKRNERDRKKLLDTVLKQLRQLVNGQVHFT
ncbi:hypothetical protein CAPTEDRAFT_168993 [Capitella teleta]|uniref:Exocyst complex component n=1 Tax=Capitella teleta TaxID=283909 RepID=R7U3L6_CAPTE|nr:hypothetical protein CAPTEDRAFT_168993 [Capitella teleta]|eukprot:ELT98261.1 hypothetical protein CAPTEDRAFT_168993 [Capitella teleta]